MHRRSCLQKLNVIFIIFGHSGSEAGGTHINANMEVSNPFQLFHHPCLPRVTLMDDAPTARDGEVMQRIVGALMLRVSVPL